jgi:hypothetical protein
MNTSLRTTFSRLLVAASVVAPIAAISSACVSARDPSDVDDHNRCNQPSYQHDEATNAAGPGKCASDCDCDGQRTCSAGVCTGVARPPRRPAQPERAPGGGRGI